MSEIEQDILAALTELEVTVKTMQAANPKPDLQTLFNRIDRLAAKLPGDTPSDLVHYLQRKSYEKARLWLEGRRAEVAAGSCGH
jgi:hypothetical protein